MLTFFTSVTLTFNLVNPISIGTRWGRHNHVLTKTNQHVKYESSVINSSQNIERKQFFFYFTKMTLRLVTLTFDLVNPKSIGSCPHQHQSACEI